MFKKKDSRPLQLQVSDKNIRLRTIALVLLLTVGVGFLTYFVYAVFSKDAGWHTIEVNGGSMEINNELIFNYCVGQDDVSATKEHKALTELYTTEANRAFRLFSIYQEYENVVNLYHINKNPGKVLKVDPILYRAFALSEQYGSRILYMAPINAEYRNLFASQSDAEAGLVDPYKNDEAKAYLAQLAGYASDPDMIRVELLGDHQIMLTVSEEYQSFLDTYEIEDYIDFGWLGNAFVVDHIADTMISAGYTRGAITSYDGYTRNLDDSGEQYAFNIFDRVGRDVYPAGIAQYGKAISMVHLRDYPMSTQDMLSFYGYSDGTYATRYVDSATGLYQSALHNIVSYTYGGSCAEIAFRIADVFIAEALDDAKLAALCENGVYSIWIENRTVYYNDADITVGHLHSDENISYEAKLREMRAPSVGE